VAGAWKSVCLFLKSFFGAQRIGTLWPNSAELPGLVLNEPSVGAAGPCGSPIKTEDGAFSAAFQVTRSF
jgi:hypothetical protein